MQIILGRARRDETSGRSETATYAVYVIRHTEGFSS